MRWIRALSALLLIFVAVGCDSSSKSFNFSVNEIKARFAKPEDVVAELRDAPAKSAADSLRVKYWNKSEKNLETRWESTAGDITYFIVGESSVRQVGMALDLTTPGESDRTKGIIGVMSFVSIVDPSATKDDRANVVKQLEKAVAQPGTNVTFSTANVQWVWRVSSQYGALMAVPR